MSTRVRCSKLTVHKSQGFLNNSGNNTKTTFCNYVLKNNVEVQKVPCKTEKESFAIKECLSVSQPVLAVRKNEI